MDEYGDGAKILPHVRYPLDQEITSKGESIGPNCLPLVCMQSLIKKSIVSSSHQVFIQYMVMVSVDWIKGICRTLGWCTNKSAPAFVCAFAIFHLLFFSLFFLLQFPWFCSFPKVLGHSPSLLPARQYGEEQSAEIGRWREACYFFNGRSSVKCVNNCLKIFPLC